MVGRYVVNRVRAWPRRLRRFVLHDVLHADDPPHRLALGIALGVFFAFVPVFGAQMALVVLFAWMLGANKLVGAPIVWLTNPATVIPIYYTCYQVGVWLLGVEGVEAGWWSQWAHPPAAWSARLDFYWARVFEVGSPLVLGSVVVGLAVAYPAYLVTYLGVRRYRLKRWGQLTPPARPSDGGDAL